MKKLSKAFGSSIFFIVGVGSLMGLAVDRVWIGELAINVRWQLGVGALLALPFLAFGTARWRAVLAAALAAFHLYPALELAWVPAPPPPAGAELRVAAINVLADNRDTDTLDEWLRSEAPDVVAMLEVSEFWRGHLADESPLSAYPYARVEPRAGAFGIAVYSRLPFHSVAVMEVGDPGIPYIEAVVEHDGCLVKVLAVHTFPPVTPAMESARNRVLEEVLTRIDDLVPTVVAGDLNATLYSPTFHRFVRDGALHDTRVGVGRSPTWMPLLGPAGLDLDHVLTTDGLATRSRRRGPSFGSDHLPVVADLVRAADACVPVPSPEGSGGVDGDEGLDPDPSSKAFAGDGTDGDPAEPRDQTDE